MHDQIRQMKRWSLLLYTALSVAVIAAGASSYRGFESSLRDEVSARLEAIADLKAADIATWRSERVGDARLLTSSPGLTALVHDALHEQGSDEVSDLGRWLETVRVVQGYAEVILLDDSARVVVSSPSGEATSCDELMPAAREVLENREVLVVDFHGDPTGGPAHISILAPVFDEDRPESVIALIALRIDPYEFLYPYIQKWPGASATAETLLVKRDGNDVLFLNELKYDKDAALGLRIPLDRTEVPAVQAALGNELTMDGIDYRGVEVVASTSLVSDSEWAVVARIDAEEAYAPLTDRLKATVLAVVAALGFGLVGILLLLRMQSARYYREQAEAAAERAWLATTIDNTMSEVYVFDVETLRFTYVNKGAVDNSGFTAEQLTEMTPADLMVNGSEESFAEMFAPLLADEHRMLTFESLHRRKDGTEYPVVVRVQITNRAGERQYLAFINDITERRAAENELRRYREQLEHTVAERTAELQEANESLAYMNEELAALNEELTSSNEELASLNEELEVSNEELQSLYDEAAISGHELERLNTELSRANSAKSAFLANMSHELRTPLNSVIGFSDVMLKGLAGELNEEQRRQMDMINSSGKHLLLLINDVLDLSKIEAGRMEPEPVDFDLSSEVTSAIEALLPQARERGLTLSVSGVRSPLTVFNDRRMIRQILFNLISNAVKFTESGKVEVRVSQTASEVSISVRDTGPGIAPEDVQRVFEAFTQVKVMDSRPDGTGLGLTVSAQLARLLGGDLKLSSAVDKGSTFTLVIPKKLSRPTTG